ncbi:MAG TPA: hypothetical protein VKB46_12200 [Pyrinomonadaceae bacterium]|nr:hypothetical protein [Pyrinomonadaceae bacterium]
MSNTLVYNIPAKQIDAYGGHNVIVRSTEPAELVYSIWRADPKAIKFIQLLSTPADSSVLEGVAEALPVEIVLKNPAAEYVQLYNYTNLIDTHPVRVAIPVLPGFSKAAKLAVSLNFAVKLELQQPDSLLIEELAAVLDLYLHRSSVRQAIEPFHTLLLSFYRQEPVSLWEVAEEDPALLRYITDDGEETICKRSSGEKLDHQLGGFVPRFGEELISERAECHDCEFFNRCGGYFKWPDKNYKCDGVKRLFRTLQTAAAEIHQDLATMELAEVQAQS